jgi:N-acylglucosamine-6-phosphate 2-epimerase
LRKDNLERMTLLPIIPASLRGTLIVSCQAAPGDPLDDVDTLRRMAISVVRGGAGGLRANGVACVEAFRRDTPVPIIGIQKCKIGNEVSITPDFAAAKSISDAGADIIALDCTTNRLAAAEPWPELIRRIHGQIGKPVLADIASLEDARAAQEAGADAVATTLYGFTPETSQFRSVNWELVERLVETLRIPLIVEGHISQPEEVKRALDLGAYAVVVGSAITRPESITARFIKAMHA